MIAKNYLDEKQIKRLERAVSGYFDYIEDLLSVLAFRVERRGKLNILDLHLHSENFYRDFFKFSHAV